MLPFFFLLCLLQLVGEVIVYVTDLPIPGPVVGMALLLAGLLINKGLPQGLDHAASGLLKYLALLFVPAGVGVTLHFNLIAREWLPITASLIIATLLTIAFCGLMMNFMDRRNG
ncbi:murein hydrolase transporter LrgA [Terasakiella brassicae]|uniref:Murein hydrolase transporter LrgA n=1 Tax=Terasakiella brassicae TaxID=1634917 RepID=A0A917BTG6_9PROT|nr:CidA/LrgA family protein [Terasakiella brassicae]GGF56066.1 murein hydrolase transporter LrgA [Terasakiella brassicae]